MPARVTEPSSRTKAYKVPLCAADNKDMRRKEPKIIKPRMGPEDAIRLRRLPAGTHADQRVTHKQSRQRAKRDLRILD